MSRAILPLLMLGALGVCGCGYGFRECDCPLSQPNCKRYFTMLGGQCVPAPEAPPIDPTPSPPLSAQPDVDAGTDDGGAPT